MEVSVFGSSGVVGAQVLQGLLIDPKIKRIHLALRKDLGIQDPKIQCHFPDFEDAQSIKEVLQGSTSVFYCIGTTRSKVKGDLKQYHQIDVGIGQRVAQVSKQVGVKAFHLVSSVGANAQSKGFYLRFKGELENIVMDIGFEKTGIYRPSMLLGPRQEFRLGERIGKGLMSIFHSITPKKYQGVPAKKVAQVMLAYDQAPKQGCHIFENPELLDHPLPSA